MSGSRTKAIRWFGSFLYRDRITWSIRVMEGRIFNCKKLQVALCDSAWYIISCASETHVKQTNYIKNVKRTLDTKKRSW